MGDFNGDKKQDLAVTSITTTGVSVLLGDGAGNFGAYNLFHGGHYPVSMALADFNRDGKQDLAVADELSNNSVAILLGDGAGNFISRGGFHAGNRPNSVAAGDFNADGKQDLAVANSGVPPNVSILLGDGAGNFSPPETSLLAILLFQWWSAISTVTASKILPLLTCWKKEKCRSCWAMALVTSAIL